jgi:5-methylcytosine-specific restriction endonuclease McrA
MENKNLFDRVKNLVATERRIGIEILECLYEIEKRKAYAELRYDGLFSYCVKELGFSDSQAYQRIQAMRALKEIPELKPMIEDGRLNVSSVSKVQVHLRKELKVGIQYDKNEKLELFQIMENQTSKQVDQKLMEFSGKKIQMKLLLELDEESEQLWHRVKNLSAHKTGSDDLESLKMLMNEWLAKNDPLLKKKAGPKKDCTEVKKPKESALKRDRTEVKPQKGSALSGRTVSMLIKVTPQNRTRFVPIKLSRQIWQRDQGKCTHCGSEHALQIDHIQPFATGGRTTEENLRLLCRSCNLHFAIRHFGVKSVKREAIMKS